MDTNTFSFRKQGYYFLYSLCCRPNFKPGKFNEECSYLERGRHHLTLVLVLSSFWPSSLPLVRVEL